MFLSRMFAFFLVLFVGGLTASGLFSRSLTEDESFYLGASRAILSGDFFLRTYGFDKSFLLAWMPVPLQAVLGNFSMGWRMGAWLSYLLGSVLFYRSFLKLQISSLFAFLGALFIALYPMNRSYATTLFCEPYLFLGLAWMLHAWINHSDQPSVDSSDDHEFLKRVAEGSIPFVFSFLIKHSTALWGFLFFWGYPYRKPVSSQWDFIKQGIRTFFSRTKFFWILFLIFGLLNPIKMGSVVWLSGLGASSPVPFLERMSRWMVATQDYLAEGGWGQGLIYLGSLVALLSLVLQQLKASDVVVKRIAWIALTGWFTLGMTFLSGALPFSRYLFVSIPLLQFSGLAFLMVLFIRYQKRIQFLAAAWLGILLIGFTLKPAKSFSHEGALTESNEWIGSELNVPDAKILLRSDHLWESQPFRVGMATAGCASKDCEQQSLRGQVNPHFLFLHKEKSVRFSTWPSGPTDVKRSIDLDQAWKERLLSELRLSKSAVISAVKKVAERSSCEADPQAIFSAHTYEIAMTFPKHPGWVLNLKGRFGVTLYGAQQRSITLGPRFDIAFQVTESIADFSGRKIDFTGLFPLFYGRQALLLLGPDLPVIDDRRLYCPVLQDDGRLKVWMIQRK